MSSSNISQFSGFSDSDIPGDYFDENTGVLYHITETCLGECITIEFVNTQNYQTIVSQLSNLYLLALNQQQTGQIAHILFGSAKLVITCFNTQKVVIQGKEAKLCKNTIFRTITQALSKESVAEISEQTSTKQNSKPPIKKSKSTSFIRKVSDTIFGPSVLNEMGKLGKELKKAKKAEKKGLAAVNIEELNRQLQIINETGKKPSQKLHKMKCQFTPMLLTNVQNKSHLEETNCKTIFSHDDSITDDHQTPSTDDNQSLDIQDSESLLQNVTNNTESHYVPKDDSILQMQADILQEEVTDLLAKNNILQAQTTKQSLEIRNLKQDILKIKTKYQTVHDSQRKIADLSAKNLILEEENLKLKSDINKLNQENKKNRTTMRKNTLNSENNEEIINKMSLLTEEVDLIKTTLDKLQAKTEKNASEADIGLFQANMKAFIRQEMADLKKEHCSHSENPVPQIAPTSQQPLTPSPPINPPKNNTKSVDTVKNILVLGDATTKYLDPRRLSGDKCKVAIRTNPDARIKDIDNKIKSLSDEELSSCDAILIHGGINNISDAETPEHIINQYKQLISTSKCVKEEAQIILSSILLKKHDKLSARIISEVNEKLQEVCDADQQLHFMDNTPHFMRNAKVDTTMYLDETSLSHKGTATFAKNIILTINACLKTGFNTRPSAGNFRWAQERGRKPRTHYPRLPPQTSMQQQWNYPHYNK